MTDAFRAELFRLRRDKTVLLPFILSALGILFFGALMSVSDGIDRLTFFTDGTVSNFFDVAAIATFAIYFVLVQEFRYDTMKNICTSKTSRSSFFAAKFLTQLILLGALCLWTALFSAMSVGMMKQGSASPVELLPQLAGCFLRMAVFLIQELAVIDLLFMMTRHEAAVFMIYFLGLNNIGTLLAFLADVLGLNSDLIYVLSIGGCRDMVCKLNMTAGENMLFFAVTALKTAVVLLTIKRRASRELKVAKN